MIGDFMPILWQTPYFWFLSALVFLPYALFLALRFHRALQGVSGKDAAELGVSLWRIELRNLLRWLSGKHHS